MTKHERESRFRNLGVNPEQVFQFIRELMQDLNVLEEQWDKETAIAAPTVEQITISKEHFNKLCQMAADKKYGTLAERERIRAAIINDQATGAGDYPEAEEYADRIVGAAPTVEQMRALALEEAATVASEHSAACCDTAEIIAVKIRALAAPMVEQFSNDQWSQVNHGSPTVKQHYEGDLLCEMGDHFDVDGKCTICGRPE
jgi:hypothetical protein